MLEARIGACTLNSSSREPLEQGGQHCLSQILMIEPFGPSQVLDQNRALDKASVSNSGTAQKTQPLLRRSSLSSGSCAAQEGFLSTKTWFELFLSMFHRVSQTIGWPRRNGMASNNQKNFPKYRIWMNCRAEVKTWEKVSVPSLEIKV